MKNHLGRILPLLIIAVFIILAMPGEAGAFAGGDGSPENPYQIETAEQLATVTEAVYLDKHFVLVADIDLSAYLSEGGEGWNDGAGWLPIGTQAAPFIGSFDGGGYTISNLFINRSEGNIGLFGYTDGASILSVELVDVNVTGSDYVGGLVGFNNGGGTIAGSYATGVVKGRGSVGGLIGRSNSGEITESYAACVVEGESSVGGLMGSNSGTITGSHASGAVTSTDDYLGGLVGNNDSGTITGSYATGAVTGTGNDLGGLIGANLVGGIVADSYATGAVTGGGLDTGGLVGNNWGGTITGSYATGAVTGVTGEEAEVRTGGLVGQKWGGTITGSYYDSDTTGQSDIGKGEPKTTAQMRTPTTFEGWDFIGVWGINPGENDGYPFLRWQTEYTDAQFDGGTGDEGTPYEVANPWQLNNIRIYLDRHFILVDDINLDTAPYNDGAGWEPIGAWVDFLNPGNDPFTGSFDGNGHTISNLFIDRPGTDGIGLFGYAENATIQNTRLADVNVTGKDFVGGLVGHNHGEVTGSCATGAVWGTGNVGGLVGYNFYNGNITGSYATVTVTGGDSVGGLVGSNYGGTATASYAAGSVTGSSRVGGLVGYSDGDITGSFWDTQTSGQSDSAGGTGKTTAGMKAYATFFDAGWDFIGETENGEADTWGIDESVTGPVNDGYPFLAWQGYDHKLRPAVTTVGVDNITATTAAVHGDITYLGYPGNPTQHGVCWSTLEDPTVDNAKTAEGAVLAAGAFTSSIGGLDPDTVYYVRAYATNAAGTIYGEQVQFTSASLGTVNIAAIPGVTPPATGGAPVDEIMETDQYTGTVSWDPGHDPFQVATVYTATITLTAKAGFTFEGVAAGFFTVAGAETVDNGANSGVVTALFPETTIAPATYTVTFTVKDSDEAAIAGAEISINSEALITNDGGVATIDLENGTYTYSVTKAGYNAITDVSVTVAGAPVAETVEMTAEAPEDYITVTATSPADGATDVSRTPAITVTFSESIQADTGYGGIRLEDSGDSAVSISKSISGSVLTITPDGNLSYSANYTVTIPAGAVKSSDTGANMEEQCQFSFTTRSAPAGGGGGGGFPASKPATETSKEINAATGGTVSFGNVSVDIPAGALAGDATFSIKKMTPGEANNIVPEGLRLKLGSDVYEITTTGDRDFGENTITINIPFDPGKIAAGEVPVINYYDEETREWTALETTVEQGPDGQWYAVVEVNHLTRFAVFITAVQTPKAIKLTLGSIEATIDGEPYTLDAAPFIKPEVSRTLVPLRFVGEALGARVEWRADARQVVIQDGATGIILTVDSAQALVNNATVTLDCPAELHPPGRTFVPLRFVSETLGARVEWDASTSTITITR